MHIHKVFKTLTPALNRANKLRLCLRGGRPLSQPPEQFQNEIALAAAKLSATAAMDPCAGRSVYPQLSACGILTTRIKHTRISLPCQSSISGPGKHQFSRPVLLSLCGCQSPQGPLQLGHEKGCRLGACAHTHSRRFFGRVFLSTEAEGNPRTQYNFCMVLYCYRWRRLGENRL